MLCCYFFFFSSRRRHTRLQGDWSSDVCSSDLKLHKALSRSGAAIGDSHVAALEDVIDSHESRLEPLKNFILPGGAPKAAALHLARTVCRRAERAVVALSRHEQISPAILRYLNRLSDLLFVLARAANAHTGRPDVKW